MHACAERVSELRACRGLTPVPADFDAFWAERMAEADAQDPGWRTEPARVPDRPGCTYRDLWFRGMGGARLHARLLVPEGALRALDEGAGVPLVLQFHGYPGATRSWFELSSLVGLGCAVLAMDNPGQGGPSEDVGGYLGTTVAGHLVAGLDGGPRNLYYVRLYQDVRILCRVARELPGVDAGRVLVNGASQGGGMGLACCALNPDLVARAAILYPFLSDFRRVRELGRDEVAYEGLRYHERWFDPAAERVDEDYATLAYVDSVSFAHLVRCPVLCGTGLADTVCPPESQFAVWNALTCERHLVVYPAFGHEEIQDFDDRAIAWLLRGKAPGGELAWG